MFDAKKITKVIGIFGLLLILGGFVALISYRELNIHFLIMVGLGVVSLFPFIFVSFEKLGNLKKIRISRQLVKAFISIFVSFLIVVILVFLYLIASYKDDWRLDLTEDQIYSLSQQTYNVLNQLDENKKYCLIVAVDTKEGTLPSMSPKQRAISHNVKQYLANYEIYSDRVIVKYVNPYKDVPEMAAYALEQTTDLGALRISLINDEDYKKIKEEMAKNPGYIVKEPKDTTSQKLSQSMMVEEAPGKDFQYTRQMQITGFKVEEAITKAIDLLLGSRQPQIYFLEGNGELTPKKELVFLGKIFEDSLFKINYFRLRRVTGLDEKSDSAAEVKNTVPTDCDILFIASPKIPYSPEQIKAIKEYLNNGGRAVILADAPLKSVMKAEAVMGGYQFKEDFEVAKETNNLADILKEYGVEYTNNPVMEIDTQSNTPNTPTSILKSHKITEPLLKESMEVMLYFPGSLKKTEKVPEGINLTSLVSSKSEAYQKLGDMSTSWSFDEATDKKGPFDFADIITKKCEGENCKNPEMMIAVFSDADFISDDFFRRIRAVFKPNIDLIKNATAMMANAESKIAITPRKQQDRTIQMDKETYNNLWVFTVIDIPLLIFLLALFLVFYRRQK